MSLYTVQDLPEGIPKDFIAFTSEDDLLAITKSLREKFGITYFAHVISFSDGRVTVLANNLEVLIHWIVNKHFIPGNTHQGMQFPSGCYLARFMGEQFPETLRESLSRLFNIDHMFAMVESTPFYRETFAFAAESDNFKIINFYLNNLSILRNFIVFYQERAKNLISKAINEPITMSLAPKMIVNPIYPNFSENFSRIQLNEKVHLTKREIECLQLTSKGKTAKEVARVMNISPRTVEYYLSASKEKLDCHFKSELIEKFIKIYSKNNRSFLFDDCWM